MKKLCVLLSVCLFMLTVNMAAFADDNIGNISTANDPIIPQTYNSTSEYAENQIVLATNYYVDLSLYEGEGPFDFHGVQITCIEPLFFETTQEEIAIRIEKMGSLFSYCITITPNSRIEEAIKLLNNNSAVICAEPNYIIYNNENIEYNSSVENNSLTTGNVINSTNTDEEVETDFYSKLEIDTVMTYGFGNCGDFTVAVFDSGFESHTGLENNLNMSIAYDAHNNNSTVNDSLSSNAHGNMCVGFIGADHDDSDGVKGICNAVNIMPVQFYNANGSGNTNTLIYNSICRGIEKALTYDVKVLNISLTMPFDTTLLKTLVQRNDLLLVTSAGNNQKDMELDSGTDGKRHNSENWIVVGAVENDNTIAICNHSNDNVEDWGSNWSALFCDVFAYGVKVTSTSINNETREFYGTSYAAPQVAGACALLWSKATHLYASEIRSLILNNVTTVTSLNGKCVSGGVLNIKNAVLALYNEDRAVYGNHTKGDINNNGRIDANDYIIAQRIYNGTFEATSSQLDAVDVNNNGSVDARDYLLIKRYYYKTYYFPPI